MTPHPVFDAFAGLYEFGLDPFQVRACHVVEEGKGVLVAAPTGSGKTVVGEFAVHLALETGRKAFYTTPIKALSNQKYHDLVARLRRRPGRPAHRRHVVNGEAPVVVMTTEVLRNMLYAGSGTLTGLGYVVMDEVHYLADRSRGAVWEEVIIHLPDSVALVSLSATVSNAEEFGEWLETVRGDTVTIVEERRPVPLYQHVLVGRRMLDLFATSDVDAAAGFVKEGAPVNAELVRIARDDWASTRMRDRRTPKGRPQRGGRRPVGNGRRVWIPSRVDVLDRLDGAGLLPGDRVHLQPGGLRRGRRAVPALGHPADDARGARRDLRLRRGGRAPTCRTRTGPSSATTTSSTGSPAASRPTTPGCCRRSSSASSSSSSAGCARPCSPPRRSRSASTCRPARSSWRSCRSGTARPTPTSRRGSTPS